MENNLTGAEIVGRLRKGHIVRRTCWIDDLYIRICNEEGFDKDGNAIVGRAQIYTHSTRGYFLHLAYSSQSLREPRAFGYGDHWEISTRDSEGVAMLFADDWEDYGFMSDKDFNALTEATKNMVRENIKVSQDRVIEEAKHG